MSEPADWALAYARQAEEAGDQIISPLDWAFSPLRLVTVRGGPTFIKLLKGAIDKIIGEFT